MELSAALGPLGLKTGTSTHSMRKKLLEGMFLCNMSESGFRKSSLVIDSNKRQIQIN